MQELKVQAQAIAPTVCKSDRPIVWGCGSLDSPLVIVGEAPGRYEELQGRPFAGPAGKILDRELARVGLPRERIYITNVVKCRPIQIAAGRISNRAPSGFEARAWLPYLMREIEIIAPGTILCMGAVAARWLIRRDFALTRDRGRWLDGPFGAKAMATFHPAYILRTAGTAQESALAALREDLRSVRKRLEERGEMPLIEALSARH